MEYQELTEYTENHPSLLLLREKRASLILAFYFESFQGSRLAPKSEEDLLINLALMIEELQIYSDENEIKDPDYLGIAKRFLDQWCSPAKRYLRRYTDDRGEILYELTSYSEKTLLWLDELGPREFIGTESRFTYIYQGIQELLEGSQEDPEERIQQLTKKRDELDREIENIRMGQPLQQFEDWQIRERFEDIGRNARTLISDFREVEENFKEIIQKLFEEEINHHSTRGDLLRLTYWGDLDPQGFEILHLLRSSFPETQSVCMEKKDYSHFNEFAHSAGNFYPREKLNLTLKEQECYQYLIENKEFSRIEQERIDNEWVYEKISLLQR